MYYLISITFLLLTISLIKDKEKTKIGLKIALRKLIQTIIPILIILIVVSFVLFFIPGNLISKTLSHQNKFLSTSIATIIGSITMIPGFIAFPLSGILKQNGTPYMVIAAFTNTLMMVGILTFSFEKKYLGFKLALLRNMSSLLIAIIVSITIGFLFGEIL